jgi:hypothetical protein
MEDAQNGSATSISSGGFTILRQIRGALGLHCETPHSSPIISTSKGSEAIHKTVTEKNVAMRMRDGVTLKLTFIGQLRTANSGTSVSALTRNQRRSRVDEVFV